MTDVHGGSSDRDAACDGRVDVRDVACRDSAWWRRYHDALRKTGVLNAISDTRLRVGVNR